jgi:hypothetical protein
MRKCVLKKWNEKMKPAASRASSEWMTMAMLITQPGMKSVKNFGNHRISPDEADDEDAPEHREVVEALPIRPAVELRARPLPKNHFLVGDEVAPILHGRHHRVRPEDRAHTRDSWNLAGHGVAQRVAAPEDSDECCRRAG